ncbi:MAG: flagella synthesis protein FlgN [Congregibacter sp.]
MTAQNEDTRTSSETPEGLELLQLLSQELGTLQVLDSTLSEEYAALVDSAVTRLEEVTGSKVSAVESHRNQQQQRLQWMNEKGLSADLSLGDLVSQVNDSQALRQLQAELSALAAQCQENNRRNGGLIVRLQERAQGALDVLRGESSKSDVYSLSGAKEHGSESRSLGKA